MDASDFTSAAARILLPVLAPMGFQMKTETSGRVYAVEFESPSHVVSVSFEPGEDHTDAASRRFRRIGAELAIVLPRYLASQRTRTARLGRHESLLNGAAAMFGRLDTGTHRPEE